MPGPGPLTLSPAAQSLGLGDPTSLQQQVLDEEMKKKKKILAQAQAMSSGALSPASSMLFPPGGLL
jgi:hypothetical protein